MSVRFKKDIVLDTDPLLRQKSEEVTLPLSKEDEELCEYMIEHLRISQDDERNEKYGLRPGVGIAACQIGEFKKIFAMLIQEEGRPNIEHVFVNPKIVSESVAEAYLAGGEGCLSVEKDHEGFIYRKFFVTIEAYDYLTKTVIRKKFRGYPAIVVQHEMDHLNGILFIDHIDPKNPFKYKDTYRSI